MEQDQIPEQYRLPSFTPTVVFNDGTVLEAQGSLNTVEDSLWIWTTEAMDFVAAVTLFSDATKTSKITINTSELDHTEYDGYTKLNTIKTDATNHISVRLMK